MEVRVATKKASPARRILRYLAGAAFTLYVGFLIVGPYLLGDQAKLVVKLHGDLPAKFVIEGFGSASWLPEVECVIRVKDGIGRFERGSISQMFYYGYIPTYFTKSSRQVEVIRLDPDGREIDRIRSDSKGVMIVGMEDSPAPGPQVFMVNRISPGPQRNNLQKSKN
ncbi:MAG: hypothetical protein WCK51_14195 [Armatimonadota bacterium]